MSDSVVLTGGSTPTDVGPTEDAASPDGSATGDTGTSATASGGIRRQSGLLRILTLVAPAVAIWYFSWLLSPSTIGTRWLYGLLVTAELFNLVQAVGFWWTVRAARPTTSPHWFGLPPEVDLLIPTYDEPVDIVERTVQATGGLEGVRATVYLLDDGDRAEMADLAARYGVTYLARDDRSGAKAGNLNHALRRASSPFVAVFDCDHVPSAQFFPATVGHLHDPRVAYVQTPQHYTNRAATPIAAAAAAQQDLFFGAVAEGRQAMGAMYCCGTNVVFRRRALDDVGGFPEQSLTEDFVLSIRLHEEGWTSAYVSTVLARGLGPEDMRSYVGQQARWAQGCLSAVPRILSGRLPLRLRAQYLLAATSFLSGLPIVVYLALPLVRIFAGAQPIRHGAGGQFLVHFVPYLAASVLTLAVASRGRYTFGAYSLTVASFWISVVAAARCLARRRTRFVVTPKRGSGGRQLRAVLPAVALSGLLCVAIVYELAVGSRPVALTNVAFAVVFVVLLLSGAWSSLAPHRQPRLPVAPTTQEA